MAAYSEVDAAVADERGIVDGSGHQMSPAVAGTGQRDMRRFGRPRWLWSADQPAQPEHRMGSMIGRLPSARGSSPRRRFNAMLEQHTTNRPSPATVGGGQSVPPWSADRFQPRRQ